MGDIARSRKVRIVMDVRSQIEDHMPVVCSDGSQFATVDHLDAGNTIKLTKDDRGQHHWMPIEWVTRVDRHVHVDRPSDQAKKDWSATPPSGT
jgi:hypothetical protein